MKRLPLTDFRAVRSRLDPHEFAISDGQDAPPSDLVEQEIWDGGIDNPGTKSAPESIAEHI
jgi:hypothetical protein